MYIFVGKKKKKMVDGLKNIWLVLMDYVPYMIHLYHIGVANIQVVVVLLLFVHHLALPFHITRYQIHEMDIKIHPKLCYLYGAQLDGQIGCLKLNIMM